MAGVGEELERRKETSKNEAETLLMLSHKNIIKVLGKSLWQNSFGILMEYLPVGNLDQFLSNKNISDIPYCIKLRIAEELSEAISFLHGGNSSSVYVHGDIKPENVLLSLNLTAKLADFGSINIVACTGATTLTVNLKKTKQHTPFYTAPEFLNNPHQSRKPTMDVYSFSMVIYEILTRKRVFRNASLPPKTVLQLICDKYQKPDLLLVEEIQSNIREKDFSTFTVMVQIMKQSWSKNANDRPTMQQICTSLFEELQNVNKTEIEEQVEKLVGVLNIQPLFVDDEFSASIDHFRFPFEEPSLAVQSTKRFHSINSDRVGATSDTSLQHSSRISSHVNEQESKTREIFDFNSEIVCDNITKLDYAQPPETLSADETTSLLRRNSNIDFMSSSFTRKRSLYVCVSVFVLLLVSSVGIVLYLRFTSVDSECSPLKLAQSVTKSCTNGRAVHSVCSFKCAQGKRLVGKSSITCQDSLKWSDVPATCNASCPLCLTGPECKESTSWTKLKTFIDDIGPWPWETANGQYAGYAITCQVNKHEGSIYWDCTCTDILLSVSNRCNDYQSPSGSCEHALAALARAMVAKKVYPKPCDATSMTTRC